MSSTNWGVAIVLDVVYRSRLRLISRMTTAQRYGPWCFGGFVALRLALLAWFFAHSKIQDADVLARREYGIFSRRGALQVDVRFERNGQVRTDTVRWQLSRPVTGARIKVRVADSGIIKVTPANVWEILWFETWLVIIATFTVLVAFALKASWPLFYRWHSTRGGLERR
jgi:hypothetical protein